MTRLSIGASIGQSKILDCRSDIDNLVRLLEKNSDRLDQVSDEILEEMAEAAAALANEACRIAAIIRGRRAYLSAVDD